MTTEWKDITDPEELFRLKREGWEIEYFPPTYPGDWMLWEGKVWALNNTYRARTRQPKMKKVKMLCWLINGMLYWYEEKETPFSHWIRQPHLDLEAEVPE